MTAAKEKRPSGDSQTSADDKASTLSLLPTTQRTGNAKTGANRYMRLFTERGHYVAAELTDRELGGWFRLTLAFVVHDGVLLADDAHLAAVTKMNKAWPVLRDKLLMLGLGRIDAGLWIDDHQRSSLELQRAQSVRGSKGAAARWGGGRNA